MQIRPESGKNIRQLLIIEWQEAFSVRLRQIHLINVSPVLSKVLMVLKSFMKMSVSQLVNFHMPKTTTFYEHISQGLYGWKHDRHQENFAKQLETNR